MSYPKALSMIWRSPGRDRRMSSAPAPEPVPVVNCRHCGGAKLKLSYRRRDKSSTPGDGPRTTFILRCAACEGFTTVSA